MKILFTIAEAFPFIKCGGLGDVGGSLPPVLQSEGMEVRVILPKYAGIPVEYSRRMRTVANFKVNMAWRRIPCRLVQLEIDGVIYYFIANEYYFGRERTYGYVDDGERFAFFSKAALESLTQLNFQADNIHCHDWHTALIPLMLKENFGNNPYYFNMKTVLTIHNLAHQGVVPAAYFDDVLGLTGHRAAWDKLELGGSLNYLKAGIMSADLITTVSPTYAEEIKHPDYGENLDGILRQRKDDIYGILNGIDTIKYDPQNDPHLLMSGQKEANKRCLQEMLNLPVRSDLPLIGIVSRLVDQKGLDLVVHVVDEFLSMDVQIVVLGTGERRYEEIFQNVAAKYPHKLAIRLLFDETLAHKIYGGSDLFLMPSRFEPCGLSQLIAMRYGSLPIVRETGGLKDTVIPYNQFTGEGTGFSFANYNASELLFTVQRAVKLFMYDKDAWGKLTHNARTRDVGWGKSARQYRELYQLLRVS
jgi:starch synthase